ncbi:hypothetical protein C8J56DRAFT_213358 [Mycena floridula]|nr:hypothetical protein C8J56DRAFT_213358 [Mycena floridula]
MDLVGLDQDVQLHSLNSCFESMRQQRSIFYACAVLFLFDYCLTFGDEFRFIWAPRRITLNSLVFCLARYPAFICTIFILCKPASTVSSENIATGLRVGGIIASELILGLRTFAIWENDKRILGFLAFLAICGIIPAGFIVSKDMRTGHLSTSSAPPSCEIIGSTVGRWYILPYSMIILFEIATLSLSLVKIIWWRHNSIRTPLIESLWRDGILYFSWMIALGFVNIGLVLQTNSPQLRVAFSQLQMTLHSMLSTRIVLHLADLYAKPDLDTTWTAETPQNSFGFTSHYSVGTLRSDGMVESSFEV